MRRVSIFFCLLVLLQIFPFIAVAESIDDISIDPAWLSLLHYEKNYFGEFVSLVDDERFFFSPNGKKNPKDELKATILAFRNPLTLDHNQHPLCLFPARKAYLSKHFVDIKILSSQLNCDEFNEWSTTINAKYVTLVFPSAFINNPASTFGHTLLRLDNYEQNPLLAYAANYAAYSSPTDSSLMYALKGVFGGYHGEFSLLPYYKKVEQYNDLEDRDIWEYRLNLNEEEVQQLVNHLWELRKIQFLYFYFDENCSYQLLSLLEAARPSFKVKEKFSSWVLPIDTVRALLEDESILQSVKYRPSKATLVYAREKIATKNQVQIAKQIALGKIEIDGLELERFTNIEKAHILDLSYEYVNYKILSTSKAQNTFRERAHRILTARSKLQVLDDFDVKMPSVRPDEGHLTSRGRIEIGTASSKPFYRFEYRGVYHDLLDPLPGFMPGAAIELGKFSIEQRKNENIKLHNITIINAESLSPRGNFIKPISWSLKAELSRMLIEEKRPLVARMEGAMGYSWKSEEAILSSLLRVSSLADNSLNHGYALGIGPKLLMITEHSDMHAILLSAEAIRYGVGDNFFSYQLGLDNRITIGRNRAIRLGIDRIKGKNASETITKISFDFFF
jgi:hypothetical protein